MAAVPRPGGTSANSKGAGTPLPGIETALGNLSATLPATSSDSGSQQGTTYSAIADGTQVTIASGDAASLAAAQALSRDTAQANAGALVRAFDDARREEISLGFEAAQLLSGQTAVFLANRAQDAKEWDAEHPGEDPAKSPYATWGAGGVGNIVLTALNGAASGKVTGSLGGLVQASAVNVLQSLAVSEVKQIADKLGSEEARAGLQALTACGGAVASGQGDCGGAALGAAASVVLNNLLDLASTPKNKDLNGDGDYADPGESLTLEEQQARTNLVATLIGAIAEGAGLNTTSAVNAAIIETQNNAEKLPDGTIVQAPPPELALFSMNDLLAWNSDSEFARLLQEIADERFGGDVAAAQAAYQEYADQRGDQVHVVDQDQDFLDLGAEYDKELQKKAVATYADLASCAYEASCQGSGGFTRVNPEELGIDPNLLHLDNGLDAEIYRKGDNYVVAYAGTDPRDIGGDVKNDIQQASGVLPSDQYDSAVSLALKVYNVVGPNNLTFVGHSLGGGEAAIAGLVTGTSATTFNAAPISLYTLGRYEVFSADKSQVKNYYVEGDAISASKNFTLTGQIGDQNVLQSTSSTDIIDKHKMKTIIESLKPSKRPVDSPKSTK